jgi:hypothetical protein
MTKKELCILCRVTSATLGNWLNIRFYDDLQKLGYQKNQKVLLPKQIEFIVGKLNIELSDIYPKKDA